MNNAQSGMGRKRTKDFGLPPRVYKRGNCHYYVDLAGKWHPLGKDEAVMRHRWAEFHGVEQAFTLSNLVDFYTRDYVSKMAPNTIRQYKSYAGTIHDEWGSLHPDHLTTPMVARWRDAEPSKVRGNGVLAFLRGAYHKGVELGLCATNPVRDVSFNDPGEGRDRYLSDAELAAIRQHLPPWGQTWLDLSYIMATRVSQALRLKWADLDGDIMKRSVKTKVLQTFNVEGDLKAVIDHAKTRPILGLYIVATERGKPVGITKLQGAWRKACLLAGVEHAQARDVRAKSGTDAEAGGLNYQALLGHRNASMSERYLRNKRTVVVPSMTRRYLKSPIR